MYLQCRFEIYGRYVPPIQVHLWPVTKVSTAVTLPSTADSPSALSMELSSDSVHHGGCEIALLVEDYI